MWEYSTLRTGLTPCSQRKVAGTSRSSLPEGFTQIMNQLLGEGPRRGERERERKVVEEERGGSDEIESERSETEKESADGLD